jgi:hypothetical protein
LLYFAGVPGAEKPFIQVTPRGELAGVLAEAIGAKLGTSADIHPIAIAASRPRLIRRTRLRPRSLRPDQGPARAGPDEIAKTTWIRLVTYETEELLDILVVTSMYWPPFSRCEADRSCPDSTRK